jgi:hypothetical protein
MMTMQKKHFFFRKNFLQFTDSTSRTTKKRERTFFSL